MSFLEKCCMLHVVSPEKQLSYSLFLANNNALSPSWVILGFILVIQSPNYPTTPHTQEGKNAKNVEVACVCLGGAGREGLRNAQTKHTSRMGTVSTYLALWSAWKLTKNHPMFHNFQFIPKSPFLYPEPKSSLSKPSSFISAVRIMLHSDIW